MPKASVTSNRKLQIGDRLISDGSDCFVVAEIGNNHQGDIETCERMFEMAKFCGVDAVKLQKRNNRFLYTQKFFNSPYNSENAFGPTYGLHRQALEFGKRQYLHLKRHAKKLGLIFFATAFDHKSADFLEDIDVDCFKIASGDITNTPLLSYVAKFKKPMIVSTGTGTLDDVRRAYETIVKYNKKLAILHCTAVYPAPAHLLNLKVIETYRREFPDIVIGFSNHFNGISVDPVAYTMGARIIEKHFTLDRSMRGTDHAFSLEPVGMKKLVRDLKRVREALGDGIKKAYEEEEGGKQKMGKSVVAARKLLAGQKIKQDDLAFKSPGTGIPPYLAEEFYGKVLKVNLRPDQELTLEYV
ncbi:MAG: N-acetylneuraminate synthase family protein [Candidatus Curtissbacteria bacterium]|nr:N-acetylneuraminate synthase family protein [Candidatus Curtissbacteria bacterium]